MGEATKNELEEKYEAKKKYLRAKETAEYLSIGLSTVWLYAKQGKLTPKKISTRVTVFRIEELDNLINSAEV
jgi:predicted DNA-binding transcriptional regulator AlpA